MHHDFIDRYSRLDSPLHRLGAGLKLASGLAVILVTVICPITYPYPFPVVAGMQLAAIATSRIPPGFFMRRLLLFEPFILAIAALTLLQPDGFVIFSSVLVKSTLSLVTVIILSNTTPFSEVLAVFRRARVPALFVTLLALMYRYVFILIDEIERMKVARDSRTFTNKGSRRWSLLALMLGQLFIRTSERAERVYAAMCARGWK
jgi:cobalt/nickel transport system permease protein